MSLLDRMSDRGGRRKPGLRVVEPQPGELSGAPPPEAPVSGTLRERLAPTAEETDSLSAEAPAQAPSRSPSAPPGLTEAKSAVHDLLVQRHADRIDLSDRAGVRATITALTDEYVRTRSLGLSRLDYEKLVDALLDDVLGLGPLQPLLDDESITEVMINNHRQVFVERHGRLTQSPVAFDSQQQLRQIIDRIVSTIGRRVDESSPMCDARLRDGSRVNVIIPPLAIDGPSMTIRKFSKEKLLARDLIDRGSGTREMFDYLAAAVRSKLNILISGGTGSGKTTLLNILSAAIPSDERIVTIEDAAELQLQQVHVIRLESRPPNIEGHGAVAIRDLVKNALRMRPDRVVVGECRGGEALDMLQAMSTGHEGSMSTIHANTPADALARLETMVLMAGTDLPSRAILKQIASAVDVIVQTQRLRGGARRIVSVGEVAGLVDGEVAYHELFQFRQVSVDESGTAIGYHTATGLRSTRDERFAAAGELLQDATFEPARAAEGAR